MNKNDNILLDLFSGTGGFALGLKQAGFRFKKHYFSEIEKHAVANYKYNFKDAEYIGSITDVRGSELERPTVITFGSPCQDFSLAGKRKGMEGERSSLILEAIRLISETQPDIFIWENVKGTFSSNNGADFWAILNAFTNIGGYRLEWQLLNTKWFLPQNRERIYLIGHLATSKRGFRQVFPIGESDERITEGSISTRSTKTLTAGGNSGGMHSSMTLVRHRSNQPYKEDKISPTLRNGDKSEVRIVSATKKCYEVASEGDSINFSQPNSTTRRVRVGKGISQTLETQCNQAVVIAQRGRNGKQELEERKDGVTNSITSVQKDNYVQWDSSGKGHNSQQDRAYYQDGHMGCIPSGRTEDKVNVLLNTNRIRRLTEIECERLQGFPDNWTKYGIYDGEVKEIASTNRYKCLGNAVPVKVVEELGKRLLACH